MGIIINFLDLVDSPVFSSCFRIFTFGLITPHRCCAFKIIMFPCGNCHFLIEKDGLPLSPHAHTSLLPPLASPQVSGAIVLKCWRYLEISKQHLLSQTDKLLPQVRNSRVEYLFFISSFLYQLKSNLIWKINPFYFSRLDLFSPLDQQILFPIPTLYIFLFFSLPIILFPFTQSPQNYIVFSSFYS